MKFLIHYFAKTPLKDLRFNIISSSPVSAASVPSLLVALARDATIKTGRDYSADDIIVANVIPLPDADPELNALEKRFIAESGEIGGS